MSQPRNWIEPDTYGDENPDCQCESRDEDEAAEESRNEARQDRELEREFAAVMNSGEQEREE